MINMKKTSNLFTEKQIKKIEAQIANIEQSTAAEIVPVISSKSSNYDEVSGAFAFGFSLIMLSLYWFIVQMIPDPSGMWDDGFSISFNLLATLTVLLISYYFANKIIVYLFGIKRYLVDKDKMKAEVEANAQMAFQRFRVKHTKEAVGVLVYISLFERMVHVIGDEAINQKISQDQWQSLSSIIVTGFKSNEPFDGLTKGIDIIGELLAKQFPISEDNPNEISNTLNFID